MNIENEIGDEELGRWLAGELSGSELEEFEKSDAYKTYMAIAEYTTDLSFEGAETTLSYESLKQRIDNKSNETPVVKIRPWGQLAVAASLILIVGLSIAYFFNAGIGSDPTTIFTAQGETKSLILPCKSEVQLNISSSIEYDSTSWKDNRTIEMSGEAYFKVNQGSRFTVNTEHGTIEVLGTEFNIRNRRDLTEIICFEGKVKVTDLKGKSKILMPSEATRLINGELEENWTPAFVEESDWQNGVSSFHESPLNTVIEELENQYKVSVQTEADLEGRIYVGAFPHDNLQQALTLICEPMQLEFTIKSDTLIVIQ